MTALCRNHDRCSPLTLPPGCLFSVTSHPLDTGVSEIEAGPAQRGDLLFAKISLDTPANLLESVFRSSSSCCVSSARASSDVYEADLSVVSSGLRCAQRTNRDWDGAGDYIWLVVWLTGVGRHLRGSGGVIGVHRFSSILFFACRFQVDRPSCDDGSESNQGRAYGGCTSKCSLSLGPGVDVALLAGNGPRATVCQAQPGHPGHPQLRSSREEGPASFQLPPPRPLDVPCSHDHCLPHNTTVCRCTGDRLAAQATSCNAPIRSLQFGRPIRYTA